jgi:hypothetical protein
MELGTRDALCKRHMATRRHGILHEVCGLNATQDYGALNLQALMCGPHVMTRISATWSATKRSASLCEADGLAHRFSPLSCGVGPLWTDRPVLSVAEVVTHLHLHQRGTVVRHNARLYDEFTLQGVLLRCSDFVELLELEAVLRGEHNAKRLCIFGHNDEKFEMLHK